MNARTCSNAFFALFLVAVSRVFTEKRVALVSRCRDKLPPCVRQRYCSIY